MSDQSMLKRAAAALLVSVALTGAAPAWANPAHVLLIVPAGAKAPADLGTTLSTWRETGDVADVTWLDADQRANPAFETFIELVFPSEDEYRAWAKKDAPQLQAPIEIHHVDVLTTGEQYPRDSNDSTFQVDAFQDITGAAPLSDYATQYVRPLMEKERLDKAVLRYTVYAERAPDGHDRAWMITEYRDPADFARAAQLTRSVSGVLDRSDGKFAQIDRTQASLRTAGAKTVAKYVELPPPPLIDLPDYEPQAHLTGTLRIYGSDLKNAVEYLARGFQQSQPDLKVSWNLSTSSEGALAGLYTGVSDVAPMGDDAKLTDEMPFYNVNGYLPTEISIATGGYEKRGSLWAWAIAVNKDNPLNELSVDELKRIFGAQRSGGWKIEHDNWLYTAEYKVDKSQNIRTWQQIGVRGPGYANKQIQTYGYAAPGFQAAFERHWFNWSHKWNPNLIEYVERKEAVDGPDGDAVASERPLEILAHDKYGMAIAGMLHIKNEHDLKVLKISEHKGGPYYALTPQNVANRSYPLHRDAYFYVNKAPGQPLDPTVREFMRFVLSRQGQQIIARVNYYYPLDRAYLDEQLKKLGQ